MSQNAIIYSTGLGISNLLKKSKTQCKGWYRMSAKKAKKATSSRAKQQWKAATAHSCWDSHFLLSGTLRKADTPADKAPVVSERQCLLVFTKIVFFTSLMSRKQSGMLPSIDCQISHQTVGLEKSRPCYTLLFYLIQKMNVNLKLKCINNRFHYSIIKGSWWERFTDFIWKMSVVRTQGRDLFTLYLGSLWKFCLISSSLNVIYDHEGRSHARTLYDILW